MALKYQHNAIALIYSEEKDNNQQIIQLLLKLGFLCKWESDISLLETHLNAYNPTLIFAPNAKDNNISMDDNVMFITGRQPLYRELSYQLLNFNHEQWHSFLSKAPMDYLTKFLWYICDADLLKQILNQLSLRTAQFVIEELEKNYRDKPHSSASQKLLLDAEHVTAEILNLCFTVHQLSVEEQ